MMLRVLLVTGTVPPAPCGVGDYTFKLAQSLAATGSLETAVMTGFAGSRADSGAVAVFPIVSSWRISQAGRVFRFLKQWKPDIVHVQYPTQGYGRGLLPSLVPWLARLAGAKSVQTWHEGFGRRDSFKLFMQLTALSRNIVVRSNFITLVHPLLRWPIAVTKPTLIANASAIPRTTCSAAEILAAKTALLNGQSRLIVFFGFLFPPKGVEQLFEIADPQSDHIVLAGTGDVDSPYVEQLKGLASNTAWEGRVTFTGFVSPERAATILAAADAVILPFRHGSGPWNTSIHSATINRAFVITTSTTLSGYDPKTKVYYALPDDVPAMRGALARYGACREASGAESTDETDQWHDIAGKHLEQYLKARGSGP